MPTVLSVQSRVAYGHVGNAASVFPLQRLGIEAWALDTVAFSNHTGHGRWRGSVVPAAYIAELFEGVAALGVLPQIDAVLSGYLGDALTGPVLLDIVEQVRAANPNALFCCDPVIGDVDTGPYVTDGIAEFFRDTALALADIITPNRFELEYLTGHRVAAVAEAASAAAALRALGPKIVLVTSIELEGERIAMLAAGPDGVWSAETPRLPVMLNGCGDVTAALFLGRLLRGEALPDALALTAASMYGIIDATMRLGRYELALVAAQQELISPSLSVAARKA
ncbi:MAG: pyridoxal kinase PdxY [Alphaproteobacteria bacterium]|nr:pyridoxal kinase PdxY [Alphaproteobacteria bacterium]MBV9153790.1 pyridoxal kinase PdxY [Alphaproteobacteria bacterium]